VETARVAHDTTPHSHLDLSELRSSLGSGASQLLRSVIPVFLRELPARKTSLQDAFSTQNAELMAQVCHGLKGSCAILGARKLSEKFGLHEELAYEGNLPSVREIDELIKVLDSSATELRKELDSLMASAT